MRPPGIECVLCIGAGGKRLTVVTLPLALPWMLPADVGLTKEQLEVQQVAQEFAAAEFAPHAALWDEKKIFPEEALRKAAALGFAGLFVREDVGGSALGRLDGSLIVEALAAGCTSTAAYLTIHNMCAWMIDTFGNDEQRHRFLPKLVTMEVCWTVSWVAVHRHACTVSPSCHYRLSLLVPGSELCFVLLD